MTQKTIKLNDRTLIEIKGPDAKSFLQGLVSNDINKPGLIYSAMLNNQGRFLYDFFIFKQGDSIFLDCFKERLDEIFKKLNFFKLKANLTISKRPEIEIFINFEQDGQGFIDPRHQNMPKRLYCDQIKDFSANALPYHQVRILNKVPESEHDLTYEKSIINEFGFDNLNAIDYEKGCYIGQELTARTHHLGQIRKKIYLVTIQNCHKIEKNHEISCNEKKVGLILSSAIINEKLHALALIKTTEITSELFASGTKNKINIVK